ncbi:u3 small nucleolar rna-interacting protein 2 [Limosa lapponica baueri]|uniref:U3 small nucleolar rna-interacting protein 2 n=1 Tax=Limosa lapponica baueri TaxID=1758121 RepID=A0A2I0TPS1_LIMLA|nr:u3 small nucleolar rna-interacting protein 2 [Limosa lapponica baueri]
MERRPPSHPRQAWEEKGAAPAPSSRAKPYETCEVQPLQTDPGPSTLALDTEEKESLDIIQSRPKDEAQKLQFLDSICTICSTTSVHSTEWHKLYFCQLEVVETVEELLQEEPTDQLSSTVRQQAMLAITSMSRAKLLLQEKKSSLLHACFCSVFHLPPQDSRGPSAFLYSKTLAAMDSMLQTLIYSAGTLSILELQNILQLLLSFANSQLAVVQERAIARIARLAKFVTTCSLPQMFMKYLQPTDRVDIILIAIKSLRTPSATSIKVAALMVDVLVVNSAFQTGQVLNIVWAIYGNLPSITAVAARKSVERALLVLTNKHPTEVVTSLMQCSPTCNQVAGAMWKTMFSEPQAAKKVLQELLSKLMNQSLRKTSTSTKDNPRILSLAATRTISEILLHPTCLREVDAIFPRLFLALLFQVSFTTELMVQEVHIFWKEHQQDLLTPIRSAVKAMKELLCVMGFEKQMLAIEAQGGWDALLSTQTHLMGVRTVAREMMTTQRPLRHTLFCHLLELLSVEDPTWEMVAMTFFIEVSLTTPLPAPSDAQFSHAHCCGGSWGSGWAPVATVEEQVNNPCGVVWCAVGHGGSPQPLPPPSGLAPAPTSLP